jgi:hypothetical protein
MLICHVRATSTGAATSRSALSKNFSLWFLRVCHDQIRYMTEMFGLDGLAARLTAYAERNGWRPEAAKLLVEVLHRGEMARGDAQLITRLKERTARDVLAMLVAEGMLGSDTTKGPVSLRFPSKSLDILFPQLFLET